MDSCLQTQDTKSARVELAYPDYKSSALTSKLLLKLLYVSNCQNKAPFSFALPTELIPRKLGDIGVEPMTQKVFRTFAVRAF